MHPLHPYAAQNPDYAQLAQAYPALGRWIRQRGDGRPATIPFGDARACRALNYALLWVHFGIRLEIPLESLCPPVASRLDYLLYIRSELARWDAGGDEADDDLYAIDVGTGASCIYPLLAPHAWATSRRAISPHSSSATMGITSARPRVHFLALDTNARSLAYAQANVERNQAQGCIHLHHNPDPEGPLLVGLEAGRTYNFCMCNPPFYEDEEQRRASLQAKARAPATVCTGSGGELYTQGGEVAFAGRLVAESLVLRERITLYTCLLGHRQSANALLVRLREARVPHARIQTMRQGRTSRWIAMWSFRTDAEASPKVVAPDG